MNMARKCDAYLFITGKGVAWCRLVPMSDGLFFSGYRKVSGGK